MKKIVLLLMLSIILSACTQEASKEKVNTPTLQEALPLHEAKTIPRKLELRQDGFTGIPTELMYYCWAENLLTDCNQELNELQLEKTKDLQPITANMDINIDLYMEELDKEVTLPIPDQREVFLYKNGEYELVDVTNNSFKLPAEEGVYTYIFKMTYETEAIGTSFYAASLRVKKIEE